MHSHEDQAPNSGDPSFNSDGPNSLFDGSDDEAADPTVKQPSIPTGSQVPQLSNDGDCSNPAELGMLHQICDDDPGRVSSPLRRRVRFELNNLNLLQNAVAYQGDPTPGTQVPQPGPSVDSIQRRWDAGSEIFLGNEQPLQAASGRARVAPTGLSPRPYYATSIDPLLENGKPHPPVGGFHGDLAAPATNQVIPQVEIPVQQSANSQSRIELAQAMDALYRALDVESVCPVAVRLRLLQNACSAVALGRYGHSETQQADNPQLQPAVRSSYTLSASRIAEPSQAILVPDSPMPAMSAQLISDEHVFEMTVPEIPDAYIPIQCPSADIEDHEPFLDIPSPEPSASDNHVPHFMADIQVDPVLPAPVPFPVAPVPEPLSHHAGVQSCLPQPSLRSNARRQSSATFELCLPRPSFRGNDRELEAFRTATGQIPVHLGLTNAELHPVSSTSSGPPAKQTIKRGRETTVSATDRSKSSRKVKDQSAVDPVLLAPVPIPRPSLRSNTREQCSGTFELCLPRPSFRGNDREFEAFRAATRDIPVHPGPTTTDSHPVSMTSPGPPDKKTNKRGPERTVSATDKFKNSRKVKDQSAVEDGASPQQGSRSSNPTQRRREKCPLCEKTLLKRNIARHISAHNGKRWPCPVKGCEATLANPGDVPRHVKIVHGKRTDDAAS